MSIRTQWSTLARNSETPIYTDAFVTGKSKKWNYPKLSPDVISEVAHKVINEAHFAVLKPNDVLRSKYGLSREELKRTIRAVQVKSTRDLADYIKSTNPQFLGIDPQSESIFRTKFMIFEPTNPIEPHTDYFSERVLTANTCTQDLMPEESLSEITYWNLDPEYYETDVEKFFDKSKGWYLRKDIVESGSVESCTLKGLNPEEGYITFLADWLLSHSASKQNSQAPRRINTVDIYTVQNDYDVKDLKSRPYKSLQKEADLRFLRGDNLYFDFTFFD